MMSRHVRLGAAAALCTVASLCSAFVLSGAREPVRAQAPASLPCLQGGTPFKAPPEIHSSGGHLRATLKLVSGQRILWGSQGENTCNRQWVRYFVGSDNLNPQPWPTGSAPIPGPTFRAQLGDLIEITFFNQVDKTHFAKTLDRGTIGTAEACDQYVQPVRGQGPTASGTPNGDTYPDCIHGSSTTNVHFHGTHTSPSTTGDNVLLFIPPAMRTNGVLQPSEAQTNADLKTFYTTCEAKKPSAAHPWPTNWKTDMPPAWQQLQAALLKTYDTTTKVNNKPIPTSMQLSAVDQYQINHGAWPQYQLGANPYCWPIPVDPNVDPKKPITTMGQAPGTHWYHAHKHGSTALNVANGMTGVFIIEGPYDRALQKYYGSGFRQQVMMLQQLSTNPFPLTSTAVGNTVHPGAPRARISVNGVLNPAVTMQPGEVQMWRVVNGAFRDSVQFAGSAQTASMNPASNPCPTTFATPSPSTAASMVQWRQIAQDGVQLRAANYDALPVNNQLDLAPAARADFLVQAPTKPGNYAVCIVRNQGATIDLPNSAPGSYPKPPNTLLTVVVPSAPPVTGNIGTFIPSASLAPFPTYLSDITPGEISNKRTVTFGGAQLFIDGASFRDEFVSQTMKLGHAEQWTVRNLDRDKEHPFHIHINPFQVVAVFEPNAPQALDPTNPCFVNPLDPTTWNPCPARQSSLGAPGRWIWWDTFAIPSARQVSPSCTPSGPSDPTCNVNNLNAKLGPYGATCALNAGVITCTGETIPGSFTMNSRFVDFTGQYVLHCHILIHEDRGMMQLVEVVPDTGKPLPAKRKSIYHHH